MDLATIQTLAAQAAKEEDYTQVITGVNFERVLPAAGAALCRFKEYIEIGQHPTASQMYPDKKPTRKARFVFEIVTPKHQIKVKEGTPEEFTIAPTLNITINLSKSDKGNFVKLFKKLNYKQEAIHPAQLLGSAYLCDIVHAWKKGDDKKTTKPSYANLKDTEGVFTLRAPRIEDPLAGTSTDIPVPNLNKGTPSLRVFLYDNPTMQTWDSLFIDGTYTKDDKEISKNWLQNMILGALDFNGSKLDEILSSDDGQGLGELPTEEVKKEAKPIPESNTPPDPLDGLV